MNSRIIYLCSAYTGATPSTTYRVQELKHALRSNIDIMVLEWSAEDTPANEFYTRNMENVRVCNLMVVLLDQPSVGVGMELAEAIRIEREVLCLHSPDVEISRLVISASLEYPFIHRETYESIAEAAAHVNHVLESSSL